MNAYWLNLPVESIRNTGTFFEGLDMKVDYSTEQQTCTVTFHDGMKIVFTQREQFTENTGIAWKEPSEYAAVIHIMMQDATSLRNLLHIAMLSGGEILKEPFEHEGRLMAYFEDYNGYHYAMISEL